MDALDDVRRTHMRVYTCVLYMRMCVVVAFGFGVVYGTLWTMQSIARDYANMSSAVLSQGAVALVTANETNQTNQTNQTTALYTVNFMASR